MGGRVIGEYEALAQLGGGGMGVVYRARHLRTGAVVALKTVQTRSEAHLESLRREVRALQRVTHPSVVRIFDQGLECGVPWYAMELIDGETLLEHRWGSALLEERVTSPTRATMIDSESWHAPTQVGVLAEGTSQLADTQVFDVEAAPTPTLGGPEQPVASVQAPTGERLHSLLGLFARLCSALAFLHGEGIVHRDLKPDNIIVRPDGTPVLVDFGLAQEFAGARGRDHVSGARGVVGTAAYMAPEQLRDQLVDARADLYSLGCVLYELLTGRPPFVAVELSALVRAQLLEQPLPPSKLASNVPAELDELVLKLLAKRPADRVGYADDVRRALKSLDQAAVPSSVGPRPTPYLYRSEFVGRAKHMQRLRTELDAVFAGPVQLRQSRVVLVSGESGIGKTRFLLQAMREVPQQQVLVIAGGCNPSERGGDAPALEPLRAPLQALADHCRVGGDAESEFLLNEGGSVLAAYEPALTDLLPGAQQPAKLPPVELQRQALGALTHVLGRWAEEKPLLLVLDDLQWADALTLRWLSSLVEAGGHAFSGPVAVVASYRSEQSTAELRRLAEGTLDLRLEPLDATVVHTIIADMLALDEPPVELVEFLAGRSHGNPFFVSEYLRAAVAQGLLTRDIEGRWQLVAAEETLDRVALPSSLAELVALRLERLPELMRRVVGIASTFGRRVKPKVLLEAYNLVEKKSIEEERLDAVVSELLARHVFELRRDGSLLFAHDKLHEVAYSRLGKRRRLLLHAAAAQAIRQAGSGSVDDWRAQAQHYEAAGSLVEAASAMLEASRLATSRGALPDAHDCLDFALRVAERAEREAPSLERARRVRLEASLAAAEIESMAGNLEAAEARFQPALQLAESLEDPVAQARVHATASYVAYQRGRGLETRRLAERAAELLEGTQEPRLQARVQNTLGIAWGSTGHFRRAIDHYTRAEALSRQVGDDQLCSKYLGNISINRRLLGELQEGERSARDAVGAAGQDRTLEAHAHTNLGRVLIEAGKLKEAEESFRAARRLAGEVGLDYVLAEASWGLGVIELRRFEAGLGGELERVKRRALHALELANARGYASMRGVSERLLGLAFHAAKSHEQAQQLLRQSVATLREAGEPDELADSLLALGRCYDDPGSLKEARTIFSKLEMQGRLEDMAQLGPSG